MFRVIVDGKGQGLFETYEEAKMVARAFSNKDVVIQEGDFEKDEWVEIEDDYFKLSSTD